MRDGQFDHVVAGPQRDHVVVHARPRYLRRVFKVEFLRLKVFLWQRQRGQRDGWACGCYRRREGEVSENVLFLPLCAVPKHHHPVAEHKHLGVVEHIG